MLVLGMIVVEELDNFYLFPATVSTADLRFRALAKLNYK